MIYYVEDDQNIRELVVYTLEKNGLPTRGFESGAAFFAALRSATPRLILLDIMLPEQSGLDILKKLRNHPDTAALPIIMITAKDAEYDKVLGLDLGADDYIAKPFGMMELVARVHAVLRRSQPKQKTADADLSVGRLVLSPAKHKVTIDQTSIELTHKEFELLHFLMQHRGIVFDREHLLDSVWGFDNESGTRTVDVHIQTLRQKLGDCSALIETVRGVGYRFEGEDA